MLFIIKYEGVHAHKTIAGSLLFPLGLQSHELMTFQFQSKINTISYSYNNNNSHNLLMCFGIIRNNIISMVIIANKLHVFYDEFMTCDTISSLAFLPAAGHEFVCQKLCGKTFHGCVAAMRVGDGEISSKYHQIASKNKK